MDEQLAAHVRAPPGVHVTPRTVGHFDRSIASSDWSSGSAIRCPTQPLSVDIPIRSDVAPGDVVYALCTSPSERIAPTGSLQQAVGRASASWRLQLPRSCDTFFSCRLWLELRSDEARRVPPKSTWRQPGSAAMLRDHESRYAKLSESYWARCPTPRREPIGSVSRRIACNVTCTGTGFK